MKDNFIECPLDEQNFSHNQAFQAHLIEAHPVMNRRTQINGRMKASTVRQHRQKILDDRSLVRRKNWETEAAEKATNGAA